MSYPIDETVKILLVDDEPRNLDALESILESNGYTFIRAQSAEQALLATLMYTILGVPAAMLWGAATFIMALVPVFGTFTIWGPIAVYLALTDSWVKALVLVGWGALAVGTIDNILYPYLVGDRLRGRRLGGRAGGGRLHHAPDHGLLVRGHGEDGEQGGEADRPLWR